MQAERRWKSSHLSATPETNSLNLVGERREEPQRRFRVQGEARQLFRKVARRALVWLRWIRCVFKRKENWMEKQLEKFNNDSPHLESNLHSKQLGLAGTVFNKHDYSPNRETELKRDVLDILTRLPASRTSGEVKTVLAGLQAVKSFSEYPANVQEKLCQVAWYQRVPGKKVIIRQGHKGLNFYFVLTGHGIIKVVKRRSDGVILSGEKVVFRVNRGSSFGDIALLHNVERTATVESVTEMSLLVIGRDDFLRIFMQREVNGVASDHVSFLAMVTAFKSWPIEKFSKSKEACVFHYFKRGKVIVADSTTSDYLYVVKAGTCEVLKQLKSVEPRTALQTERELQKRRSKTMSYGPSIGYSLKSSIPGCRKLPAIENKVLSVDGEEMVNSSLYKVCKARNKDPTVEVDLPKLIMPDLDRVHHETLERFPNAKPSIAHIVKQILSKKNENGSRLPSVLVTTAEGNIGNRNEVIDDEEYREIERRRQMARQKSLACVAAGSVLMDEKATNKNDQDDSGFSKSKLQIIKNKWKHQTHQSTNYFKEMNAIREHQNSPEMVMKRQLRRQNTYTRIPALDEREPVLLAHEGKQQAFPGRKQERSSPGQAPVFVRLALLRPKDIFGLDTLEFDDNYKKTETSVSLISRGAEVLMISKAFFLSNCTSENLEHLRNIIAPYPSEEAMQYNLQVSSDWNLYCNQQLNEALFRRSNSYIV